MSSLKICPPPTPIDDEMRMRGERLLDEMIAALAPGEQRSERDRILAFDDRLGAMSDAELRPWGDRAATLAVFHPVDRSCPPSKDELCRRAKIIVGAIRTRMLEAVADLD